MSQTLIFDAYTAYLGIVTATLSSITVYDGPQSAMPVDKSFVIVGCADPLASGMVTAVDAGSQDWETLGAARREETFLIHSTMVVWNGDGDLAAARAIASTNLTAVGAALRPAPAGTGDAMLNNVLNQNGVSGWCGLSVTGFSQIQDTSGCALHVFFDLAVAAHHI